MANLPDFYDPQLTCKVEALDEAELDRMPFGAIRLSGDGTVILFSEAERRLSGFGDRSSVGLSFFHDIAPCMDSPAYRGRIEQALARGTLDLEFMHIGDFEDRDRELTVRAQSASDGGYWIFMRRD